MKELALNILDLAQNSISARATLIELEVIEDTMSDFLKITLADNGCGMTEDQVKSVTDPFYTTRTTRKVGLGVPFFKMAAEMAGGSFSIESEVGKGTRLAATFGLSNVDRMPVGDMEGVVSDLIYMNPQINFTFRRRIDSKEFFLDTAELKEILGDVPLNSSEVFEWISGYLKEQLESIK
ncbi:MAG: sensor histidine kinase [Oscillospiraceae bacterium]|nr:sensor histidine kinase [Oscillospiraceae bacterium]